MKCEQKASGVKANMGRQHMGSKTCGQSPNRREPKGTKAHRQKQPCWAKPWGGSPGTEGKNPGVQAPEIVLALQKAIRDV
jgi:hypothetical protein